MENKVIGIEGYVGAGKTSICRKLINLIPNSIILEGGNLYRAIYSLMTSGINLEDLKKNMNHVDIKSVMEKLNIEIKIENRDTIILIDGKEIDEQKIQSAKSSVAVSEISKVADNKNFYAFGKKIIDQFKEKYNVIVSGRDLMKIYPELDYHIFIIASLDERIHRKCIQYNGKCDEEEVRRNILERDKLQEESGYYKIYDKTIVIDVTNCKSAEESANEVLSRIGVL